jgi:adenosylcobinamide-phosphate guanylyltransferase
MMEALIHAGGKGSRMGGHETEKPMLDIGGVPVIKRVVDAISSSTHIGRVLVSVSDNTKETEKFLISEGVETIHTSGEDFVDDLHKAFDVMDGRYVLTAPCDIPLLKRQAVDMLYDFFDPDTMESAIAVISEELLRSMGMIPSYSTEINGRNWVLSGLCIMDRIKTLTLPNDVFIKETYMLTEMFELAVNVNTHKDLEFARKMAEYQISSNFL